MAPAFRFSAERGLCPRTDAESVAVHLKSVGLPTTLAAAGVEADGDRLAAHMESDKKRASGRLPFVLARGIGAAFVDQSVAMEEVRRFLDAEGSWVAPSSRRGLSSEERRGGKEGDSPC